MTALAGTVREWTHGDWRTGFEGRTKGQPRDIPAGEWDNEPDKIQWIDEETGLDCLMVRNHFGNWCGYVGVAPEHPLYQVEYSQTSEKLVALRDAMLERPVPESPSFGLALSMLTGTVDPTPEIVIEVHGGLTFSGLCQDGADEARHICHVPLAGRPDKVWWFGFDCAHAGDFSPGLTRFPDLNGWRHDVYRNRAYVEEEVGKLARQLAALR